MIGRRARLRTTAGLGAVVAVLLAAPPALADTIIDNPPNSGTAYAPCDEVTDLGQSFITPVTGDITALTLFPDTTSLGTFSGYVGIYPDVNWAGQDPIAFVLVDFRSVETPIAIEEPAPVSAGETYRIYIGCTQTADDQFGLLRSDGFSAGQMYTNADPDPGLDLAFSLTIETDSDGDGVETAEDACPGTTDDSALAPKRLNPNHYWSTPDGFVDPDGRVVYSLADTGGCSASQIIEAARLGAGHSKHGIPGGALRAWTSSQAR